MNFPSFVTTGGTRDIQETPLQYQPFNLLPLIQLLKNDNRKTAASTGKSKSDDFKLEGRIGAVNQVMEEYRKYDKSMKAGFDLMGSAYTVTPEYARDVRGKEMVMSPEIENIVKQQSADVKRYEANIKGKGNYFHLGAFAQGMGLYRNNVWKSKLERGYSSEIFPTDKPEYVEGFDFDPVLYDIEDARKAIDALYTTGKVVTGKQWAKLEDDIVGDLYGVKRIHGGWRNETNFQEYKDKDGNIIKGGNLGAAHDQSLARAFAEGFDFTDPIAGGLMQSFMQRVAGNSNDPFKKYRNKNGEVDDEGFDNFIKDFQDFAKRDLFKHYEKRKETLDTSTYDETFNISEEGTKALGAKKAAAEMANGFRQERSSAQTITDFGLPLETFKGKSNEWIKSILGETLSNAIGLADEQALNQETMNAFFNSTHSPFYKQNIEGKDYVNINENSNMEMFYKDLVDYATKNGIENPSKWADEILGETTQQVDRFKKLKEAGKTYKATGRTVFNQLIYDVTKTPNFFYNILNRKDLKGQPAKQMGSGMFAKVGETYMMVNDFGNLKYDGVVGGATITQNTIPTNLYTVSQNDKGETVYYHWASPQWRKMSNSQKNAIIEKSKELSKSNPMYGTSLLNPTDMSLAQAVEKSEAIPMDEFTEKHLKALVSDPNSNINMIFASPGAIAARGRFVAPTEADMAKELQGKYLKMEVPESYIQGDNKYKQDYTEIIGELYGGGSYYFKKRLEKNANQNSINKDIREIRYGNVNNITDDGIVKILELDENEIQRFKNAMGKLKKNQGRPYYDAAIANFKLKKNYNYQNEQVYLSDVPISENGKVLNPLTKDDLGYHETTKTVNDKTIKESAIYIDFDATGVVLNGSTDPSIGMASREWYKTANLNYENSRNLNKEKSSNTGWDKVNPIKK